MYVVRLLACRLGYLPVGMFLHRACRWFVSYPAGPLVGWPALLNAVVVVVVCVFIRSLVPLPFDLSPLLLAEVLSPGRR